MSIEKVATGYLARWREANGRQRARRFARKVDAEQFLATVRVDTARGAYIAPDAGRETISEYAASWADAQPWRESSRDRMTYIIRAQIVPRFGTVKLRGLPMGSGYDNVTGDWGLFAVAAGGLLAFAGLGTACPKKKSDRWEAKGRKERGEPLTSTASDTHDDSHGSRLAGTGRRRGE